MDSQTVKQPEHASDAIAKRGVFHGISVGPSVRPSVCLSHRLVDMCETAKHRPSYVCHRAVVDPTKLILALNIVTINFYADTSSGSYSLDTQVR